MELKIGLLAPKLYEQLECDPKVVEQQQKDLDAIYRLGVRGILTYNEARKAESRVVKNLGKLFE